MLFGTLLRIDSVFPDSDNKSISRSMNPWLESFTVSHGHGLHAALSVVASQPVAVCSYGEYLLNKMDHHHLFEKHPLQAKRGEVALPDRPGFGIELDDSRIRDRQRLSWT